MRPRLTANGVFFALAMLSGWNAAWAQPGTCPAGQYKYCDGDCPPEHTGQGECTTRLEQVGGTTVRWCCCYNDYRPEDAGGETTEGGPPTSIGECPVDDGAKPPEPSWAATAAVKRTANPGFTDAVLYLVRDNVLKRNPKAKTHVDAVYRFSREVDQLLAKNPKLAAETATLLGQNLSLLLQLANTQTLAIAPSKVEQAVGLLEKYSKAAGASAELKQAIARAQADLKNNDFLQQLGILVRK